MPPRPPVRALSLILATAALAASPGAALAGKRAPRPPAAVQPPVPDGQKLVVVDADGDDVPEVWSYYADAGPEVRGPARLLRRDIDLNRDGRPDIVALYAGGKVHREELDLDFDGQPDQVDVYEGGERVRSEVLRPGGGVVQVRFYEGEDLARVEVDGDADGRPERVEYWRRGAIVRVSHDDDSDGEADRFSAI